MTMFPIEEWNWFDETPKNSKPDQRAMMMHAMDLVFTMIGCIVLNIDHRPNVQRFEKVLSPGSMNTLRKDLENLLIFEKKLVNSFLISWIKIKYSNEVIFTTGSTSADGGVSRKFLRKSDLRLAILRVIKSMIFRTRARSRTIFRRNDNISFVSDRPIRKKYCNRSIIDFALPIEYPRKVRIIALAEPHRHWTNENMIALKNGLGSSIDHKEIGRSPVADLTSWKRRSSRNSRFSIGKDITINHVCKKFHCPLCYGWLWLPVIHAIYIFSRIIMSFIRYLIEWVFGYYIKENA